MTIPSSLAIGSEIPSATAAQPFEDLPEADEIGGDPYYPETLDTLEEPNLIALRARIAHIQERALALIARAAKRELDNHPLTYRSIFNVGSLLGISWTAMSCFEIAILVYLDNFPAVKVMGIVGGAILTLRGVYLIAGHSPITKRAWIYHCRCCDTESAKRRFAEQLNAIDRRLANLQRDREASEGV